MYSKRYLESQLAVALGGRVAEEIVYGEDEVTTGASNDLQQVRNIARRMVAQWGFANEALGEAPVAWEGQNGNGLMNAKMASEKTEKEIDEQVQIMVDRAYMNCMNTLSDNKALMDELTERLIADETVDYDDLIKMRDTHCDRMAAASGVTVSSP